MALADISFTNNVGTLTFQRAMLDVGDEWQWDGRSVVHRKRITVDAYITRDHAEDVSGLLTQIKDSPSLGKYGTLTLPWTSLNLVKFDGMEIEPGGWQDMVKVQASFTDDKPASNMYVITFFGLSLYNPRIGLPIPAKNTYDYYTQVPLQPPGSAQVAASNPFYGPVRFRTGYAMMTLSLSGSLMLEDGSLPAGLIEKLQKRIGVGGGDEGDTASLPNGYPAVFKLGDAIPEIAKDLALTCMFVTGGQIAWSVEKQVAKIQLHLMTQPQAWAEV